MFEGINAIWSLFFGAVFLGGVIYLSFDALVRKIVNLRNAHKVNEGISVKIFFEDEDGEPNAKFLSDRGPVLHQSWLKNNAGSRVSNKNFISVVFTEDIEDPEFTLVSDNKSLKWLETSSSRRHCTIEVIGEVIGSTIELLIAPAKIVGVYRRVAQWTEREVLLFHKQEEE